MDKQHIEMILENKEDYERLLELDKLYDELYASLPSGQVIPLSDDEIAKLNYVDTELEKLLDKYYVDHKLDRYYVLEDGMNEALGHGIPFPLISSLKHEQELKRRAIERKKKRLEKKKQAN